MKIIIIGLGLIGGSIAKQLSEKNEFEILAYDLNQESINNALVASSITGLIHDLDELGSQDFENALVVIATPPKISLEILRSLSFLFNSSVTITDTASIKLPADQLLAEFGSPSNVVFSHPIAGSHHSGEQHSVNNLFQNKQVIISSPLSASEVHIKKVRLLWNALESEVINLDTQTHDYILAHSSHLPHVASYALLMTLRDLNEESIAKFSGGGFGEFLRLASSSPEMWADIFSLNQANIISSLDSFIENLNQLKTAINNQDAVALEAMLSDLKNFKETNY